MEVLPALLRGGRHPMHTGTHTSSHFQLYGSLEISVSPCMSLDCAKMTECLSLGPSSQYVALWETHQTTTIHQGLYPQPLVFMTLGFSEL